MRIALSERSLYLNSWKEYLERYAQNVDIVSVEKLNHNEFKGYSGMVWHWGANGHSDRFASAALQEATKLGLLVYPLAQSTALYESKIAQAIAFSINDIPTPENHVFLGEEEAHEFVNKIDFPIVCKRSSGSGASGVSLVKNRKKGHLFVKQAFRRGIDTDSYPPEITYKKLRQLVRSVFYRTPILYCNRIYDSVHKHSTLEPCITSKEKNFIYFQEYIPNNACDYRITVIGDRIYGMRRLNRVNDFRASGSGVHEFTPESICENIVQLAFVTASKLNMSQSCAVDILVGADGKPLVVEVSFTFANALVKYPGYWDKSLCWHSDPSSRLESIVKNYTEMLSY